MTVRRTSSIGSTFRSFFGVMFVVVGTLATLATVVGFFGSLWWGFDIAADYRMQELIVLVAVAVLYGLIFGRGAAAIFAIAAVIDAVVLVPLWLGGQPPSAGGATLSVATYNAGRLTSERDRLLDWLRTEPAQIVFVEETTAEWDAAFADADLPYRVVLAPPARTLFGTTILASVDATAETSDVKGLTVSIVSATVGDRPVELVEAHAARPRNADEAAARTARFSALGALLADRSMPTVLVGDLGTTRWSHAFSVLTHASGLRPGDDGFGFQPTWGVRPWPVIGTYTGIPTDHVLVGSSLTTLTRVVGPDLGTDHRPLVAELTLAGAVG